MSHRWAGDGWGATRGDLVSQEETASGRRRADESRPRPWPRSASAAPRSWAHRCPVLGRVREPRRPLPAVRCVFPRHWLCSAYVRHVVRLGRYRRKGPVGPEECDRPQMPRTGQGARAPACAISGRADPPAPSLAPEVGMSGCCKGVRMSSRLVLNRGRALVPGAPRLEQIDSN